MKYVRLVDELKRSKSSQKSRMELHGAIQKIQAELDEAWKRLAAHRRLHAFGSESASLQKCHSCGAGTLRFDERQPLCEFCAADLEAGRKPPQREKSELKANATTA
jgi:hypothetical protein